MDSGKWIPATWILAHPLVYIEKKADILNLATAVHYVEKFQTIWACLTRKVVQIFNV